MEMHFENPLVISIGTVNNGKRILITSIIILSLILVGQNSYSQKTDYSQDQVKNISGIVKQKSINQSCKTESKYSFESFTAYKKSVLISDKSHNKFTQMKNNSGSFLIENELPWEDLGGGVSRQVLGYNKDIMIAKIKFQKGSIGSMHNHIHSQSSVVASGVFELTIDGKKKILKAGDGYFVMPDMIHGAVCIEEGMLIDAFSPMREDFLKK